ncbi:hypothetical protein TNCV_4529651 [Trichonephila clavipes]|nr:hypothetical protein TNCV_4529651 [Trichonephila clavipes]
MSLSAKKLGLHTHYHHLKLNLSGATAHKVQGVVCAHLIVRDHWVLSCKRRCPDQVVSLKREPQCKSAAEAHRMLSNTYGEVAISERTCREWFQRFKNGDFDVEDQHGI